MSNPDFRTFIDTLSPGHTAWLAAHANLASMPNGGDLFFQHYVGDPLHQDGLLWQYEAWRFEHGYTRVRPWNGSEALGRVPTTDIPSPGFVYPWFPPASAGPSLNPQLAGGRTTANLQADFGVGNTNALGLAILDHWNLVHTFSTLEGIELANEGAAIYSIRFWGFMKWSSVMRNRLLGIPVFPLPIEYDADGVPLSDIEFMDVANRWHNIWHVGTSVCASSTAVAMNDPFAPVNSPFGQFCSRTNLPGDFLLFHRDLLNTYDNWRRREGMPPVERWKPPALQHFHEVYALQGGSFQQVLPEKQIDDNPALQDQEIKDEVKHFNTLAALAAFAEGDLHSAGHGNPEDATGDIADIYTNNYSPRFMAWHHWIDYLWEVRQPRFDSFRPIESDGTDYPGQITIVHHVAPQPDQVQPNNALTNLTANGSGSLWIKFNIRPETYGRPLNLAITAQVYRNSSDLTPVPGLDAIPIPIDAVQQGVDLPATEIQFHALDADGVGAFAKQNLPGGAVGFKNGRIRITGHLQAVGQIPGSIGLDAVGNQLVVNGPNDQFDYTETIDIILVKENRAPVVSTILNESAFSVDDITVKAAGAGQATFSSTFFIVVQDPPEPPVGLGTSSIFADPARTVASGIAADGSFPPGVEVVDSNGNPVNWFTVALTDQFKEQPALSDNVSQRVLFQYLVIFDVHTIATLLPNTGDVQYAYLKISARDRAGNTVQNVLSAPIKLFHAANPYMIDVHGQNPYWLSFDTRVFSVRNSELKFNHSVAAAGNPNQYLQDVINEFNAGTQNFEGIPADENQAPLELLPQVNGENVYNFALARVRVRTQAQVPGVSVFFRLFTTAVSNLSFTNTNYPTSGGATPIALLGRTSPDAEIVSIPCFAAPRVETRDTAPGSASMATQPDPANVQTFDITPPGGETIRYFGAYLDINSDTPRYPAAPAGDGPFPASQCVSIRDIIRGQHQCMVAEIFYTGDPTDANATPATSDNLAQRNLLIIETANPGRDEATRTVQHSFDIVLAGDEELKRTRRESERQQLTRMRILQQRDETAAAAELAAFNTVGTTGFTGLVEAPFASTSLASRGLGVDELVFFWNNLPPDAQVEIYLPSLDVEYVMYLRNLRLEPQTVRAVDEHTLALTPGGVTYLPIPNIGQERLAGLLTVTLPAGIKAGQVYTVDVLQARAPLGIAVGAFRLTIPVNKALRLYAREIRVLTAFEERLRGTDPGSRWYPILSKQVDYLTSRALGLAEEAVDECSRDTDERGTRICIILEKIKVLDYYGPLVHGSGEVSFTAHVIGAGGGGVDATTRLPLHGTYPVHNRRGGYEVHINKQIFRGTIADDLTVEIAGTEAEEAGRTYYYKRAFSGNVEDWLGSYKPSDQMRDPENVGDWQVWYRIEKV